MFSARDNEGHLKVCLTLIFKVNYRGKVTYVSDIVIPNFGYVQIDTNILYTTHDEQEITIIVIDLLSLGA